MTIPARAHFCWIGPKLPWAYVFAILSASERSELPEIVLHHTDALEDGPELRALKGVPRVLLSRIDPIACVSQAGQALGIGSELAALYRRVDSPVVRADILRAAVLYAQGGIYLDMDTITTSSLLPLLNARQFIGCEFSVCPRFVRASYSPVLWGRSWTLDLMRKAMRHMAQGWKMFRRIEGIYYRAANNAVMGAEANSTLFADYLCAMTALSTDRQNKLYALGPDLLQELIRRKEYDDLLIHDPEVFYPLSPEISEHWFRMRRNVELSGVLSEETRVVHWYASVRTRSRVALINPAYVRENQHRQLYSALVCAHIRELPESA